MFKETFYLFNSLKTFPSCLVTSRQNTTSFAFFPDFSHLLCDSDHFFRDPWVPLTFFPAATLAVYHFPIKIREVKIVLTQHSANAHTKPFKPWEAKTVWACLSHGGGLIWRKLFLESVRSEPIFIWIPAQLNWNNVLLICNSGKFKCSIELGQALLLASSEFATSCQKIKVCYMRSNRILFLK